MMEQKNRKRFCIFSLVSFTLGIISAILLILIISCEITLYNPLAEIPKLLCNIISYFPTFLIVRISYIYLITLVSLSSLAVISGFFALKQIKKNPLLKGKILAKVGIVIGILVIVCFMFFLAIGLSHRPGPVELEQAIK